MDEWASGRNKWVSTVRITELYKLIVVICLLLLIVPPVCGVIEVESVEFGFDGYYKRGRWVPLQLLVVSENEQDSFVGELEVEITNLFSGTTIQTYSTPVSLTRTDRQRYTLHVFQPGTSTKLMLRITHHDGRVRVEREIIPDLPKEPRDLFILALTPPGYDGLNDWHGLHIDASPEMSAFVVHPASQKRLPLYWKGYDSIDAVAIHGMSLATSRISTRKQITLLDWVRNGGTLLISGGSNLQYLRDSFLEPLLPGYLGELKPTIHLSDSLARLERRSDSPINLIDFELRDNARILEIEGVSVPERGNFPMLMLQRSLGSGQIVCLAFEFDIFPPSQSPKNKQFWTELLKMVGKSPRHLDDRYEPHQRDAEKIHEMLEALPLGRVPLFRMMPLFLFVCLLSIGGFTWWTGKRAKRAKRYWIGGFLITALFSCAAILPRHLFSIPVSVNRYSILSVYSESSRAHLQTYFGAIASADSKSSIQFRSGTYTRPSIQTSASPLHSVESKAAQICEVNLSAWQTRTYLVESFFELPATYSKTERISANMDDNKLTRMKHHLPGTLESAGVISNARYMHLGSIPPDTSFELNGDFAPANRLPSLQELTGKRKQFARILANEGVLQYLAADNVPKLVGWMNRSFLPMQLSQPVEASDETYVIVHLNKGEATSE